MINLLRVYHVEQIGRTLYRVRPIRVVCCLYDLQLTGLALELWNTAS